MKYFKNIDAFKKRVQKSTDWADYFMLGGKLWNIYEYGGGWKQNEPCYVYFLNKRTNDLIKIDYFLSSTQYRNGEKVVNSKYQFIDLEYQPNAYLWR